MSKTLIIRGFNNVTTYTRAVTFGLDGGGGPPLTGTTPFVQIPNAATIIGWSIIADQSGSCSFDVWFKTGTPPPTSTAPSIPSSANKISASAPIALSSAQSAAGGSSAISTWSPVVLTAGGEMALNLSSITTCTKITVQIWITTN